MNFYNLIAVGLGGMIGSIARYLTSKSLEAKFGAVFPYGTFAVNIIGSFILGIIFAMTLKKDALSEGWRLFLATGICGGYTTFSAFALENFNMLHQKPGTALVYIVCSLIGGVAAIGIGFFVTKTIS
jgi:fluoride exporter